MRQSAVGQKCPACAKTPRRARARGRPAHYVKAAGAALGVGLLGGALTVVVVAQIRFGLIIFAAATGFFAGRAAAWGAQRQRQAPFPQIAVGAAVAGIASAVAVLWGPQGFQNPWLLLGLAAAGYFAVRGLHQ
jgi:hypothetical protein